MKTIKLFAVLAVAVVVAVLVPAAHADSVVTYTLGTNTGLTCTPSCGSVTLTPEGGGEILVDAKVSGEFVATGGHLTLGFNVAGITLANISNLTAGYTFETPGSYMQSGFGNFIDEVQCTGCASGGSSPVGAEITFDVTEAGLVTSDFTANTSGVSFTADEIDGMTAPVGDISHTPSVPTPEPSSSMLLGFGLLGLVGLRRKQIFG